MYLHDCIIIYCDTWYIVSPLVSIGLGNGLLFDDTKPLLEPMLTFHQSSSVASINLICTISSDITLSKELHYPVVNDLKCGDLNICRNILIHGSLRQCKALWHQQPWCWPDLLRMLWLQHQKVYFYIILFVPEVSPWMFTYLQRYCYGLMLVMFHLFKQPGKKYLNVFW